jgi:hypothetical protein
MSEIDSLRFFISSVNLSVMSPDSTNPHYIIIDFAADYIDGDLRAASDVLDARWVAARELDAYILPAKTREVILKTLKTAR